ncbi:glb-22 [Pristionchus pacificus]|uniref:Glb-22 n=1 Tax=Pristionchus pacificus TaxID=54126 RepID=A0A2A6CT40_PRIPA|nr:glb-22 [Pristionchus pacificus]|eukprot:PDM81203.1 glb-22 [Pristionchus pacificus]
MMTAARAAGRINHYKKRTATTPTKKGIGKRISSQQSSASDDSTKSATTAAATNTHRDSLAVPDMHPLRKRSGSVPAIKMVTLASEWNMKPPHTRAIKMTWSRLCEPPRSHCKGIVALVERVWDKIDGKDATIKEIFYKAAFVDSMQRRANPDLHTQERCERRRSQNSIATLRDHTHFFVSLVSQLVQNLENDPGEMFAHLDKIGRNHAYLKQYGFKSTHWEKIGEYFIDMVVIQDCVRAYPDACRAWTLLVAAMVDRLRAAPRRGSISTIAVKGSKEELNVAPVRIFGSGNIFTAPPAPAPKCPRASVADIFSGTRRGSNGEIRVGMERRLSGGDLKMDSLKISDSPSSSERSVSAEARRRSYCKLEDVAESLIERKNGVALDCSSMSSKCPMAALRGGLPETKSSSALA